MLAIRGLRVDYGPINALENIDLDVDEGELVTLLGANGAGKSSLLQAVSGLVPISEGTIKLAGDAIVRRAPEAIARDGVAHVPEGRHIFPGLTVEQNLVLGAGGDASSERVREDMKQVHELFPVLQERCRQAGWSLSGGQQQMLAVGRAMMARPRLLMLDEPSLGLAPMLAKEVLAAVRTICDRAGTATLLVEQNARAALRIADRAYVLRNGRIVHSGSADELARDDTIGSTYLGG